MTSRWPYWCPKTMKQWPCWFFKPVLTPVGAEPFSYVRTFQFCIAAGHEGENALQFRKRCKADQLCQTGQSTHAQLIRQKKLGSKFSCLRQITEQVMDVSFNLAKTLACHISQGPLGTPEHYIPDEHDIYTRSTLGRH